MRPSAAGKSVDVSRLNEIASHAGIRFRQVLLSGNWWNQDCGPMLCSIEETHAPAALLPLPSGGYRLYIPGKESNAMDRIGANSAQQITPFAFTFYRSFPQRVVSLYECCIQAGHKSRSDICHILFMSALMAGLSTVLPAITSMIFDRAIPESNQSMLFYGFLALVISALATALWEYAQMFPKIRLEHSLTKNFQAGVLDRLLNFPTSFFRSYNAGDLVERAMSVSQIGTQLDDIGISTLLAIFSLVAQFGMMYYYSSVLLPWVLLVAMLNVLIMLPTSLYLIRILRYQSEIKGRQASFVLQSVFGIAKLRVAGAEPRAFRNWAELYGVEKRLGYKSEQWKNAFGAFQKIFDMLCTAIIFYQAFLILYPSGGQPAGVAPALTLGGFLAFNVASGIFLSSIDKMTQNVLSIIAMFPTIERIQPILLTRPEILEQKTDPGELTGHVDLSRVSFRYSPDGPLVLNDLSITIQPGEFVAIVGASGSGKSTIFRQLLGFETPESGSVLYDNRNLSDLDIATVRRQIGVVLQSGRIASGSIFELIAGNGNFTLDDAWEAAAAAGFRQDVEAMPMQMHTFIGDGGTTLSGGQRQRLLIARALVKKPRIILFDEATSALDNRTQAIVSESLGKLRATRLVIAHRLSTIKSADRIIVIQDGRVKESGSYEQLMEHNGLFASLAKRQLA